MKQIHLTNGYTTTVDDVDYDSLSVHKWYAHVKRRRDGSVRAVYAARSITLCNGRETTVRMHRVIMRPSETQYIDHIDSDGLNNCRSNLRLCTPSENVRNSRRSCNETSKYKGVCWDSRDKKWRAQISFSKKCYKLGLFDIETDAAKAYDAAAIRSFGEFARVNTYDG